MGPMAVCRFVVSIALAVPAVQLPTNTRSGLSTQRAVLDVDHGYAGLPLAFEPNVGQTKPQVRFLARGGGLTAFFTDAEAVMVLKRGGDQAIVRMKLAASRQPRRVTGAEKLPGVSNYFRGNDPNKWLTDVPHYARIQYDGVYPGIDLVWYGNQRRLEYDFVVAPGADASLIQVAYEGVESVRINPDGELVLRTALGELRQQKPRVYQEIGGKHVEVAARYTLAPHNRVSFELARYDRTREVRIDPVVLVYSTYLGGSGRDVGAAIAVDAAGSAYVAGYTDSTEFPKKSPYQSKKAGGDPDAFVTKLAPSGNALVYSTYLGGAGYDEGRGIAVDAAGAAYVAGVTNSTGFPTRSPYQAACQGSFDVFVAKLAPAGNALVYSTYLGGSGIDHGRAIAVDGAGSAYVAGLTQSDDFPMQSAYRLVRRGAQVGFVTKLTSAGSALVYSTYLGGSGTDSAEGIAVDAAGAAYVTGYTNSADFPVEAAYQWGLRGPSDAFVTKLVPAGNMLTYSTYLGGGGEEAGRAIAVDTAGSAYVTGYTSSTDFPIQSAFQTTFQGGHRDVFITKLTPVGKTLAYSTYLGGSGMDEGTGIAVDTAGSAYVTAWTASTNFPTQSAHQASFQGGDWDVAVTKLTPAGSGLVYSTYLGGSAADESSSITVDAAGAAYVTGCTTSSNFPTQTPFQGASQGKCDAFVTKLQFDAGPSFTLAGVGNAANYVAGKVSPGEIVVIFGKSFGPAALVGLQLVNGFVTTEIGETRVLFDGVAAPMIYAINGQVSCVVPYEVAGKTATQVVIEYKKVKGAAVAVPVVEAVPGLFSANSSGTGPGVFLNEDGTVNSVANPLTRGKVAVFYGTGEGQTTPGGVNGLLAATSFPKPVLPVTVTIGGKNAEVSYAGAAPYMVAGVIQINAKVPTDIPAGNAEVIIKVGNNSSQTGITLAVK